MLRKDGEAAAFLVVRLVCWTGFFTAAFLGFTVFAAFFFISIIVSNNTLPCQDGRLNIL